MSDLPRITDAPEITQMDMLRAMMAYIWPKDNDLIRKRVCLSLGLLVGAKALGVCVPFIFKSAVDNLNVLSVDTLPEATLAVTSSLVIGCKQFGGYLRGLSMNWWRAEFGILIKRISFAFWLQMELPVPVQLASMNSEMPYSHVSHRILYAK